MAWCGENRLVASDSAVRRAQAWIEATQQPKNNQGTDHATTYKKLQQTSKPTNKQQITQESAN
jgi:hypothetical protein